MDTSAANLSNEMSPKVDRRAVSERIFYMDNLRALALLLGILLHAGLAYSVLINELWPAASNEKSWYFDYWIWFVHTFRMPLFFLIAGFFAHYLVRKRGLKGFVKNRLLRITLPFVIFWPIVVASVVGVIIYAANNLAVDNAMINVFRTAMESPDAAGGQKPPSSTMHLWFLYYLSFFCLFTVLACSLGKGGTYLMAQMSKPAVSLVVLPMITALVLVRTGMPHPAPERFMPEPWALLFFGSFFTMGWVFFARRDWLDGITPYWHYLVGTSTFATVLLLLNLPEPIVLVTDPDLIEEAWKLQYTPDHFLRVVATSVLSWHMTALCLIGAVRFLNTNSVVLRYVSDGSYWAYIVHLPIVFYLQLIFGTVDMPLLIEFLLITSLTLGACYVSYAVLVRHTPVGWLLNGRRSRK